MHRIKFKYYQDWTCYTRFCKERGAIDTQRISLFEIYARVLKRFLPKDNNIQLSDWGAMELSDTQKEYAALDAWTGLQIYHKLKQNEVIGKRISKPVNEGTSISYHPWSMVQPAAYREISCQHDKYGDKKLMKAQVIVTVKQILVPNAVDRDGKPLSEYDQVPFRIVARLCDLHTSHPVEIQNNTQNVVKETGSNEQSNIGISTSQGGIHQNVIRKFGSFGASPALADAVLADYRLHHNINVGTMKDMLGLPAVYNEPGVHKYALYLADYVESFGISTLPRSLMDLYNIRATENLLLFTKSRTF
ncbi:hypothetical protein INT45_001911 [Circinella minor]|uniref:3'-5' exonuclease domain-containing protein n=1 Tax=Circinella minor TaxID=1195481 RepID=A0A8H7RRX0_9FUNG|nr:hypothetical protein INT45_001911 [Circinella minor]